MTYLLITMAAGIPLFVTPMPDAQTCAMNMQAMQQIVTDKARVACFDMQSQQIHVAVRPDGDKVD